MRKLVPVVCILGLILLAQSSLAAEATQADSTTPHGLSPGVLIGIAVMLVLAKLGGEVFERLGQPAVLGELTSGIVLGNLALVGFERAEALRLTT